MLSPAQLQFKLMTCEAQRAAVQRLALHGWDAKSISTHTGMPEAEVCRHLADTGLIDAHMPTPSTWKKKRRTAF